MIHETPRSRAALLNRECVATSMDRATFPGLLADASGSPGLHRVVLLRQPHLFSQAPVFVSRADLDRIAALIRAVESVVALEPFEREALRDAPAIARRRFGPRGVFFGYDFHLKEEGPRLIEINTNAGGAFLSLVLARAQKAPCGVMEEMTLGPIPIDALEQAFVTMFRDEWKSQRGDAPLRTIAIVDERPREQFLHPEFLLCQAMLRRAGHDARVLDPGALVERDGALFDGETAIDLVYNRLTDFQLQQEASAALRRAYEAGGVVVTPHPRAHATYADKRLLALLSDGEWLARHGVPDATREILLAGIPRTEVLDATSRARLWREREGLFFKPLRGFGSVGVHRGDELTEATWAGMRDDEYVGQRLVPAGERTVELEGQAALLKLDVRAYAYDGEVQLVGARLYQGPTTNLRSAGGGFAQVYAEAERRDALPFACWEACPIGRARSDLAAGP